jgi:hypothetical protein
LAARRGFKDPEPSTLILEPAQPEFEGPWQGELSVSLQCNGLADFDLPCLKTLCQRAASSLRPNFAGGHTAGGVQPSILAVLHVLPNSLDQDLERDDFSSNRHPALAFWWSMIFPKLFGIML